MLMPASYKIKIYNVIQIKLKLIKLEKCFSKNCMRQLHLVFVDASKAAVKLHP